jgi:hypothetical protein
MLTGSEWCFWTTRDPNSFKPERLGDSHRYVNVAADIYKLPFTAGLLMALQ